MVGLSHHPELGVFSLSLSAYLAASPLLAFQRSSQSEKILLAQYSQRQSKFHCFCNRKSRAACAVPTTKDKSADKISVFVPLISPAGVKFSAVRGWCGLPSD